ncbi:MAG TPA: heme exporter protein CcmD [Acidimicrobiales bacterium]|jgi:heme exporter protein CcmD|nr:heme exporter protein CcmD [Acidimicrobiales bacterium]
MAMTHAFYVAAGWGGAAALVSAYAVWVLRRGRALSRQVPPEERRWS